MEEDLQLTRKKTSEMDKGREELTRTVLKKTKKWK